MKKYLIKTSFLALLFMLAAFSSGCKHHVSQLDIPKKIHQPKKVALYLDDGCRNIAVLNWVRILEYAPELELTFVDGKDIRENKLKGIDLLLCPGGGSAKQLAAMQAEGQNAVKEFIRNGGSYLGTCAGCFSALNQPERMQLLPFDWVPYSLGKTAVLAIDIDRAAAKDLAVKPGRYWARYSGGPVMRKAAAPDKDTGKVLGIYKSSVGTVGRAPYNFVGAYAAVSAKYGKGKVVATGFHPESHANTHELAMGYIHAAIGVKPTVVYPKKALRPLRVGFMGHGNISERIAREFLELYKNPQIDVKLFSGTELNISDLPHMDVLIIPHSNERANRDLFRFDFRKKQLEEFLANGGKVVASGNGALSLPKHKNVTVLPEGKFFSATVLKLFDLQ